MSIVQLRPFQLELKNKIYTSWQNNNRNVLAVLPTGGGKSVVMSDIVLDGYRSGQMPQAIIAHRNELVSQMSCHIAKRGIPHRIVGSDQTVAQTQRKHRALFGQSFVDPTAATAVIGVDTLISRADTLQKWASQIHRWLGDEWHHCIGNEKVEPNKWGKAVRMFNNAYGLGVTATPVRANGQGLGRAYDGCMDDMVIGPSMRWLIDNKYLCDYEVVCPESDMRVSDEEISANGDWSSQTLRKAAKKSHIVGDVVRDYVRYAKGRRAIVFSTDIETANETAQKFVETGIRAAALNAKSLPAWREQCIANFESGKLEVLINVDLFDEGFDVPACDVVVMARPTASLGKYLQMVGRALRYIEGKVALIIDHVSNVIRHKLPDLPRVWTLARREKRAKTVKDPDEIPLTVCKGCAKPYEKFRIACPYCGYEKDLPEPRSRSVESVEGDLVLLDRETLAKMRAMTVMESAGDVAARVSAAAGPIAGKGAANRQIEKIAAHARLTDVMAQWAAIERTKGYSDREIQRRFYLTTGFDVLSALDSSKTKSEIENIATLIESWYHERNSSN